MTCQGAWRQSDWRRARKYLPSSPLHLSSSPSRPSRPCPRRRRSTAAPTPRQRPRRAAAAAPAAEPTLSPRHVVSAAPAAEPTPSPCRAAAAAPSPEPAPRRRALAPLPVVGCSATPPRPLPPSSP
ncbi:arabinogalactan protein 1-like [Miscanthus floridulus]|uniref:arabinogalactan protein 1-like n=1 Tax=Miscanthus floridulus TaxID=154761 RepID=UPI003457BA6A